MKGKTIVRIIVSFVIVVALIVIGVGIIFPRYMIYQSKQKCEKMASLDIEIMAGKEYSLKTINGILEKCNNDSSFEQFQETPSSHYIDEENVNPENVKIKVVNKEAMKSLRSLFAEKDMSPTMVTYSGECNVDCAKARVMKVALLMKGEIIVFQDIHQKKVHHVVNLLFRESQKWTTKDFTVRAYILRPSF